MKLSGKDIIKRIAAVAAALTLVLSFSACGNGSGGSGQASGSSASSSSASSENSSGSTGLSDSSADQIANPFTECDSLQQAEDISGIPLSMTVLPDPGLGNGRVVYQANAEQKMIEVIVFNNADNSGTETEAYRVRKAEGSDDISGDSNQYEKTETVKVNGCEITLRESGGNTFAATWILDGCTYAVDFDNAGQGMSREDALTIVESVE